MIGSRAHAVAARRPIGAVVERVRALAEKLCGQLETAIETTLATSTISSERLFDLSYRPIEGTGVDSLARLFDISRVPAAGFTPAKYATPWDAIVDEAMIAALSGGWDEAAFELSLVTLVVSDLNGFLYAYPHQKIADWTNDVTTDGAGNRIKRIFEDEYSLRVGRCGLGAPAEELGPRCAYDAFRAAGCELDRAASRPWGAYVYARDTKAVCNEVAMAVYVGDRRHSTLRVCYDPSLI